MRLLEYKEVKGEYDQLVRKFRVEMEQESPKPTNAEKKKMKKLEWQVKYLRTNPSYEFVSGEISRLKSLIQSLEANKEEWMKNNAHLWAVGSKMAPEEVWKSQSGWIKFRKSVKDLETLIVK